MALATPRTLLDGVESELLRSRSRGPDRHGSANREQLEQLTQHVLSRAARVFSGLATEDASASETTTEYYVKIAAGDCEVGAVFARFAEADDVDLLATGTSYQLDGSDAVALTGNGQTLEGALVAILVDGAVELHAVLGDEDADGDQAAPTADQIRDALIAAEIEDHDAATGLIVGRFKIAQSGGSVTITHVDPASDASLAAERSRATILGVPA